MIGSSLAVVALVTSVACGSSQRQEDNTTTTVERVESFEPTLEESRGKVTRFGELYAGLGASVDTAGSDCDAVATAIATWSATHRAEIKTLNQELAAMPDEHVAELSPTLEAGLRRAALQVKDGNDRCPGHQGVFDAISALPR